MEKMEKVKLRPGQRLIVALDHATVTEAERCVDVLGDLVQTYKIGLELVCAGGLSMVPRLVAAGRGVFLDLKVHDTPRTVLRTAAQASQLGATFLTCHGYPQTMSAAVAGAGSSLRILAVTVLTSSDDGDLARAGYGMGVHDLVRLRARQARDVGVAGLVTSGDEARALHREAGLILVCPGIRPVGAPLADQKRVTTPHDAVTAGADYLVVGRPIVASPSPREAAEKIIAEIAAAQGEAVGSGKVGGNELCR